MERRIVIGLLTNSDYLRQIKDEWNPEYIESQAAKTLCTWAWEYFEKYDKAPNREIGNILIKKLRKKKIKKSVAEEIETEILPDLSNEYENQDSTDIQTLVNETREYFVERQLELLSEEISTYLDKGKLEEAKEAYQKFTLIEGNDNEGLDLSDEAKVNKALELAFDDNLQKVLKFDGALGNFWNDEFYRGAFVSILAPEKRGKCLPGTQRVLQANGTYISINEMISKNKRNVISFDQLGNSTCGEFVKTKVSEFHFNGFKNVYEVVTKTGRRVQVTKNHPFLTPEGWKDLTKIWVGDFIAVPKRIPYFGNHKMKKVDIKLLAYFIADGGLTTNGITYTKKEQGVKDDFEKCVIKKGDQVVWVKNDPITCRIINSEDRKFKQNSNNCLKLLYKYELLGKKSSEKTIPKAIFKLPKKQLAIFLRTLYTGDGWVNIDGTEIGYCSTNKQLINDLQFLLIKFGIVSRIIPNTMNNSYSLSIRDYENIIIFSEKIGFTFDKQLRLVQAINNKTVSYRSFLDKFPWQVAKRFHQDMQNSLGGYFTSDFKKAPSIREQIAKKKPLMRQSFLEVKNTPIGKEYFNSHILWDEIVEINDMGMQETYDLSVKKYHNFIAENVIVHNTFTLLEMMVNAYEYGSNVGFIQAGDMTEGQQLIRTSIYLSKKSNKQKFCGKQYIPVPDCIKNQTDTCNKKIRACQFGLFEQDRVETLRDTITFDELLEAKQANKFYKNCYNCLKWQERKWGTVWLEEFDNGEDPLTVKEAKDVFKNFFIKNKRKIKLSTHANGELTINKIKSILETWKRKENFVPDILLIDYADLLVSTAKMETRHQIDFIWRSLRGLAQKYNLCIVSPTQADAKSYEQYLLKLGNFSEDKRKLAHVTAMYGLNQSPDGREKKLGIMRINKIVVREDGFHESDQVHVLQRLQIGRPNLGSFY